MGRHAKSKNSASANRQRSRRVVRLRIAAQRGRGTLRLRPTAPPRTAFEGPHQSAAARRSDRCDRARQYGAPTGLSLISFDPLRVRGFDNHRLIGRALRFYMRLRESVPLPRSWL